ncbi:hypothetical protein ACF1BS_21575 [Streptomyces sp. NPDC014748]|uniref:hypothetical protein n=1 Tax=Streptomyces sp. NPDC014748 TaxID=3364905 RepID=UPI0036F66D5D
MKADSDSRVLSDHLLDFGRRRPQHQVDAVFQGVGGADGGQLRLADPATTGEELGQHDRPRYPLAPR